MNLLLQDIQTLLVRELRSLSIEIELFPDEPSVWQTPQGIANPAGTLALHACGNLQHYVGAVLGNTGYVRDRNAEFGNRSASRAELFSEIDETIAVISAVIPDLTLEMLDTPFPEQVGGETLITRTFLLHLCTHLAFHVGQVGYLRRILTGDASTSGAVSLMAIGL